MTEPPEDAPQQEPSQLQVAPQVAIGTEVVTLATGQQMVAMTIQTTVFFPPEDAIKFGRSMVHEGRQAKTGIIVAGPNQLGGLKLG